MAGQDSAADLRREVGYIGRRMLDMELPGKRRRGRPKRRFMDTVKEDTVKEDTVKEDMQAVGVTEDEAQDKNRWKQMIRCGDP
ncbi:hypothetical protein SKAU_G00275400 [Synaphobranchus kaupii]|uniref:Uncharacterized protein n=1 Tax=Synaphobranchus kaupii TaxID=118154 RepID=A0A9Q1F154_SYNKA|nr:hypothetical protein SKAU_G00275400 [Synaphobranchus kaupii]